MEEKEAMKSEKESIVFRANMYIIEAMYKELKAAIQRNYKIPVASWKQDQLYEILLTNRTDFSKYKNRIKDKVTERMKKRYAECRELEKAYSGKELIPVGSLTYTQWSNIIDKGKSEVMEWLIPNMKILVDNIMIEAKQHTKSDQNGLEMRIGVWLGMQMAQIASIEFGSSEQNINRIIKAISEIDFNTIDLCSDKVVGELLKESNTLYKNVSTIHSYRKRKKENLKNKKDQSKSH